MVSVPKRAAEGLRPEACDLIFAPWVGLPNVRYGSEADVCGHAANVRFVRLPMWCYYALIGLASLSSYCQKEKRQGHVPRPFK